MPRASVWLLRAALVHLILGFGVGALLLAAKGRPLPIASNALLGAHRDLVLIGWMAQCVLGVAYWILPKHPREPIRGPAWAVALGWLGLNGGIAVTALARPLGAAPAGYATMAAAGLLLAGALFPRVKAFGAGR